ncbi:MAG: LPS export ABC transporter periplasmic protein LptC [Azoarcus sp.]|jgi:lipopolysaccharide export system protein LptC|nr:LPS export ABC transporter periplasmic protein LptC [Azoarcus sp.]
MRAYQLYPLAIAALLAAGSIWLERLTREPEAPADTAANVIPDFIATDVRITGFAEDGSLRYTLDSPRIVHLPQNDTTLTESPRLRLFKQKQQTWLQAERGELGTDGKRIDFSGEVEVERKSDRSPPLRLFSARLTVWPQDQRAATDTPVRLTRNGRIATANGLEADNIFGTLQLAGQARMHFPRHPRNP